MNYEELKQAVKAGTINVGDDVWVVDFRYDDISKPPARNVAPTHARIFEADIFNEPDNFRYSGRMDYDGYYFRPVGKNGNPLAKVLTPYLYDFEKVSLNIFLTEEEAHEKHREQVAITVGQVRALQDEMNVTFNLKVMQLEERLR
jgi:hypothetical protein